MIPDQRYMITIRKCQEVCASSLNGWMDDLRFYVLFNSISGSLSISYVIQVLKLVGCKGPSNYSRTSVARTLMARLPWLLRTRSWAPKKNSHSCRQFYVWDNLGWFFILIMVCCMYSLESPRWGDSNENKTYLHVKKIEKICLLCLLTWRYG